MRAIIAGGTGFIGRSLVEELKSNGWEIVVLSRSPGKVAETFGAGVIGIAWDNGDWPDMLGPETVIVNLAGESITNGRWTAAKKERILDSRVNAGKRLVEAVKQSGSAPSAIIQCSAVGFYGPRGTKPLNEQTETGTGFLAEVTRQWEASTEELKSLGVRHVVIRMGIVLGHGGILNKMLPPFRFFVGGPPGDGFQGTSWIHIEDVAGAIRFLMENDQTEGPFNLTAPAPVRMRKFCRILGETIHRPSWLNVPPFALRLLFGDMADEVVLSGQLVLPARLLEAGYVFRFPELEAALKDLLG